MFMNKNKCGKTKTNVENFRIMKGVFLLNVEMLEDILVLLLGEMFANLWGRGGIFGKCGKCWKTSWVFGASR